MDARYLLRKALSSFKLYHFTMKGSFAELCLTSIKVLLPRRDALKRPLDTAGTVLRNNCRNLAKIEAEINDAALSGVVETSVTAGGIVIIALIVLISAAAS